MIKPGSFYPVSRFTLDHNQIDYNGRILHEHGLTAAKSGIFVFAGTLLEYVCRFTLFLILARLLGAAGYGLYYIANTVTYLLVAISTLGLDVALIYFISTYAAQGKERLLIGTIRAGLNLPFLVGCLGGAGLFVFSGWVAEDIFHNPDLRILLHIAAFAVPFAALATTAGSVAQGFKAIHYKTIALNLVLPFLKICLVLLFALSGLTVLKAMLGFFFAMTISCGLMLYFVFRLVSIVRLWSKASFNSGHVAGIALPIYLVQLSANFSPYLCTLFLGALAEVTTVGIFAAAANIALVGRALLSSFNAISMPILAELSSLDYTGTLKEFSRMITKWMIIPNLGIFLILSLFSKPILSIFGQDFEAGIIVLRILIAGELCNAAAGLCGAVITMSGNTWLHFFNSSMRLVLVLILSAVLIPSRGMIGAAVAMTTGAIALSFAQLIEVWFLFRFLPYDRTFWKTPAAGAFAFAVTYFFMHSLLQSGSLISALLGGTVCLSTYVGAIGFLGVSREEKLLLRRLYEQMRRFPGLGKRVGP